MWKVFFLALLTAANPTAAESELYIATSAKGDKYFLLPNSLLRYEKGVVSGDVRVYKSQREQPEEFRIMVKGCEQHGGTFRMLYGRLGTWSWREPGPAFALDMVPTKICRALGYDSTVADPALRK